ncbi:MAG: hypothetical protein ACRCX2_04470 [Paraclostridium sp.]
MRLVGGIGISPSEFYDLSFADAFLIIKGHMQKIEEDFYLNQLANINAIGLTNSKNYKAKNPFKDVEKHDSKEGSLEERHETFQELEKIFGTKIE